MYNMNDIEKAVKAACKEIKANANKSEGDYVKIGISQRQQKRLKRK